MLLLLVLAVVFSTDSAVESVKRVMDAAQETPLVSCTSMDHFHAPAQQNSRSPNSVCEKALGPFIDPALITAQIT